MDVAEATPKCKVHHGRNVRRFREMFGIKQDTLADLLGMSQQTVSRLESQEELDDTTLDKVAKALKIPAEAIRNFNDEAAINIISSTLSAHDNAAVFNLYPTFNPIDKIVELYERVVRAEQEKVAMLESLLKEKGSK